jgi:hypothetical protein
MATGGALGLAEGPVGSPRAGLGGAAALEPPETTGADAGPAKEKKKKKKTRPLELPTCGKPCKQGCAECCGRRPGGVLAFILDNVKDWDRTRALVDANAEPFVGELLSVKLPLEVVLDKARKEGNLFRAKVFERCADGRFKLYVKQRRYPKTIHQFFTVPRSALKRDKAQVPDASLLELAYRVGEGGSPSRTSYRVEGYRSRLRKLRKQAALRAAAPD